MSLARLVAKKLDANQSDLLISTVLSRALAAGSPQQIYLFGSAARGELTEASDIDLAILYASDEELKQGRVEYYKQRAPVDWPVDVLFFTKKAFEEKKAIGGVCMIIAEEGRVLFNRIETNE